jgi:protein-L-isoaspartate(D-aspartate) O-methyltransferase
MRDRDSLPSKPNLTDPNFAQQREIMVDRQIRTFDVTDRDVIARMLDVPREIFLPADLAPFAYSDGQLQVATSVPGEMRTLVAPFVLARLMQWATLTPDEKVLVVGDGPGYAAAVVAGLARRVVALEADSVFAERTLEACKSLGIDNVSAFTGPLASGYRPEAPYDVVFVLGVVETDPEELYAQLSEHGRLMTFRKPAHDPVGRAAKAVRINRVGGEYCARPLFDAAAPVLDAFRKKPAFVF